MSQEEGRWHEYEGGEWGGEETGCSGGSLLGQHGAFQPEGTAENTRCPCEWQSQRRRGDLLCQQRAAHSQNSPSLLRVRGRGSCVNIERSPEFRLVPLAPTDPQTRTPQETKTPHRAPDTDKRWPQNAVGAEYFYLVLRSWGAPFTDTDLSGGPRHPRGSGGFWLLSSGLLLGRPLGPSESSKKRPQEDPEPRK